jgi:HD-like signal output (HDOD) protein
MLEHPLATLDDYVLYLTQADLPVLRLTARELAQARQDSERVTLHDLTRIIFRDPLMAVNVLSYIQPLHGKALRSEITTVGGAVMMLGIEPFFRQFQQQPVLEDLLSAHPEVILGVLKRIRRAQRAAHFAHGWATWRHDLNIEEVTLAALLHDLAELLLWCFAPVLGGAVDRLQRRHPGLRSVDAQVEVFGISAHQLQLALCAHWNLPQLVRQLMDDEHAEHPRVRNVALAVNLARHTSDGWQDPAIPDDLQAIGELLHLSPEGLREHLALPPPDAPPAPYPQ